MRHLNVGQPCPVDATPASRSWCSGCPEFVSFRVPGGVATIGCRSGEDVAGWLRREMSHPEVPSWLRRQMADGRRAAPGSRSARPVRRSSRANLSGGVGVFLAAVGVGLFLSAFDRD